MADNRLDSIGKNVNAMGTAPYDISSKEGGDNREGALSQVRATGIIARGKASKRDMGRDSLLKGRS